MDVLLWYNPVSVNYYLNFNFINVKFLTKKLPLLSINLISFISYGKIDNKLIR
jgi:hypothetical protein